MRGRMSYRHAVAVSVGVHALLAAGIVVLLRAQTCEPPALRAALDTRLDIQFLDPSNAEPPAPEPSAKIEPDPPMMVEVNPEPPPPKGPEEPTGPLRAAAITVPRTLPTELLDLLRRPAAAAPAAVTPVQAVTPRREPAWAANGSPVHGPLDPNQTIVYVLDASGSMGEWAKFDTARAALIATLKLQPATVRFQIVTYSGTAAALLRSPARECRPATAENIAQAIEALEALPAPAGRSQHLEGLRTALNFNPNLVLLFTDADDLPATALRGLLRQAERPVKLCVAKVTAERVKEPVEVK